MFISFEGLFKDSKCLVKIDPYQSEMPIDKSESNDQNFEHKLGKIVKNCFFCINYLFAKNENIKKQQHYIK